MKVRIISVSPKPIDDARAAQLARYVEHAWTAPVTEAVRPSVQTQRRAVSTM